MIWLVCRPRMVVSGINSLMPDPLAKGRDSFFRPRQFIAAHLADAYHEDGYVAIYLFVFFCCRCNCDGSPDASERWRCVAGLNHGCTIAAKAGAINDSSTQPKPVQSGTPTTNVQRVRPPPSALPNMVIVVTPTRMAILWRSWRRHFCSQ